MPWVPGMPIADPGKYQAYLGGGGAPAPGGGGGGFSSPAGQAFNRAGMSATHGRTATGGGSVHPHIASVLNRQHQTGTPVPQTGQPQPAPYSSPYGAIAPNPMLAYAQAIIKQYSSKPNDQAAFTNYVNSLNSQIPDTGPQIQQDIIRLLAPNYNPAGFATHTPVEQSDVGRQSQNAADNTPWLAQQLTQKNPRFGSQGTENAQMPRTPADMGPQMTASMHAPKPDTGKAASAISSHIAEIMRETPGIDVNTAYHLLEYNILKKGGDLSTKDAQALYYKWNQTPTMSPQAATEKLMPAFQTLENQKAQNAADYITMSSKQRTAAGLTSSVLSAIGMPAGVPHTREMVGQYIDYFLKYGQQNEMKELAKLMTPLNTLNRENTKAQIAGQNAGTSGNLFQDFMTNVLATPPTTDPFTNTLYAGSNSAVDPNVQAVP